MLRDSWMSSNWENSIRIDTLRSVLENQTIIFSFGFVWWNSYLKFLRVCVRVCFQRVHAHLPISKLYLPILNLKMYKMSFMAQEINTKETRTRAETFVASQYQMRSVSDGILRYQGVKGASYAHRLATYIPFLDISVNTQPLTRNIVRCTINLTPDFCWCDVHHGVLQNYWVWIEDPDEASIYHSEMFTLTKKMVGPWW